MDKNIFFPKKKEIIATIISLKNQKTALVEVITTKLHPKYHKPINKKKLQVHYENLPLKINDQVIIVSSRPYSAHKHFLITKLLP